jgi:cobalt/nickel transport system permease protein
MHIAEGVLTGPCVVATDVVGYAAVAVGAVSMKKFTRKSPGHKPLLGMAGAFIFFVSLIHIPAFGGTTCSHPCGTPLAAILLGPGVTIGLAVCSLLLQALFFAHGGFTTLGANTITLGVIGAGGGWIAFKLARKAGWSLGLAAGLAGLVGDVLTYAANIAILGAQFAYVSPSPQYSFWGYAKVLALAYLPVQGPIALGEMLVTGYAIRAIARQRPEVMESLGVVARKALPVALALFLGFGFLAPRPVRADQPAPKAAVAAPSPAVTASDMTGLALDDKAMAIAEKAGLHPHGPYFDMSKISGDIWDSFMMLAGLVPGFFLGRWWHLLFGKEGK